MEPTVYYYSDGISQFGPFSKEEMKSMTIKPDTLVWFPGMPEWKRASEVPEMREFIVILPPPLPKVAPQPAPAQPVVQIAEPVAEPVPQPTVAPMVQVAQQPVTNINDVAFESQQPPRRKKYTLLLLIFSCVGIFLSLMMMGFSITITSSGYEYSYYDYYLGGWNGRPVVDSTWGILFLFISIYLLVFSIISAVKMSKAMRKVAHNR